MIAQNPFPGAKHRHPKNESITRPLALPAKAQAPEMNQRPILAVMQAPGGREAFAARVFAPPRGRPAQDHGARMGRMLERFLGRLIQTGQLEVETADGTSFTVGDGSGPPLAVRFHDPAAERRFLRDPELAFGELFMDGTISFPRSDLVDVLTLGLRNITTLDGPRWLRVLNRTRLVLRRIHQNNGLLRSRSNVAHHYDIDRHIYELFLDADRQYSCAYFETPDISLEEAQTAKKRHIAAKLLVEPGHRVLDIGCGWGGMGLYLARHCKARVEGITLSAEQLAVARSRIREQNLDGRVDFHLQDYREARGRFDRIVSVGLFEHVGVGYFDDYFRKVADLLSEDGVALIHTIGRTDGPGATNPWIARYIFPGGYIPAMSEVLSAVERSGLIVTDVEILQLHYAETLKAWRERFLARRADAAQLYDERFCRMWEFYLAGSEAGFRLGQQVNFQFQLARKVGVVPMTRSYIDEREARLRQRDGTQAARPQDALRMAGE